MQSHTADSEPGNESLQHNCIVYSNPPDENMTWCSVIQLQLQQLEEERNINMAYISKKYKLLAEAEALSEIASGKSESIRNWLQDLPTTSVSIGLKLFPQLHRQRIYQLTLNPSKPKKQPLIIVTHPINQQPESHSFTSTNKTSSTTRQVSCLPDEPSKLIYSNSKNNKDNAKSSYPTAEGSHIVPPMGFTAVNNSMATALPNCRADLPTFSGTDHQIQRPIGTLQYSGLPALSSRLGIIMSNVDSQHGGDHHSLETQKIGQL